MVTTISIIGAFLCVLCIWLLKNSREFHEPILKMWHVLGLGISAAIPVWNFILGFGILITIGVMYLVGDLDWKVNKRIFSKLDTFLNKTIS